MERLKAERVTTRKAETDADELDLKKKQKQALEDADLAAYHEATEALHELKEKKRETERKARRRDDDEDDDEPGERRQARKEPPPIHPDAQAWLEANPWFSDKKHANLADETERIERELLKDMKRGPELYKKLTERLRELPDFDDVLGAEDDDEPTETRQQQQQQQRQATRRPPNSPPSQEDDDDTPRRGDKDRLTEHDKARMRQWRLDPMNPTHREQFLKNKVRA
jgi:hypothetical protein